MKIKGVVVCTNKYVAGRRCPRMRPNMSKHALALQPLVGSQCVSLSPTPGIMQPVVLLGCVTWVCAVQMCMRQRRLTRTTYAALAASAPSAARQQRQPLTYHELQLALPDLDVPFAIAEPQQQQARAGELAARRGEIPLTTLQSSSARLSATLPMAACHGPSTPLSSCIIVINSSPPT